MDNSFKKFVFDEEGRFQKRDTVKGRVLGCLCFLFLVFLFFVFVWKDKAFLPADGKELVGREEWKILGGKRNLARNGIQITGRRIAFYKRQDIPYDENEGKGEDECECR